MLLNTIDIDKDLFSKENEYLQKTLAPGEVKIEKARGTISNEKITIVLILSNGDTLLSDYSVTYVYREGDDVPFMINMDKYHGSTGSVVGDCLLAYSHFKGYKLN